MLKLPMDSSAVSHLTRGTVLGFDFGIQRIGVAVGEYETRQAHPLATINEQSNIHRFTDIQKLIEAWRPCLLVVGLPLSLAGEENAMSARCRRFANQLTGRYRLPVVLLDERFSSSAAETCLHDMGIGWKGRKPLIDAVAAQLILQSYLDENIRE